MTRDDALKSLNATSSHERLKAARYLARVASSRDVAALRKALKSESVSFVKRALLQAIDGIDNKPFRDADENLDDKSVDIGIERQAYMKAVHWVTSSFLHEINPRLGAIKLTARKEMGNYDDSLLKQKIDSLSYALNGFEEIQRAARVEEVKELNFYELIVFLSTEAREEKEVKIFLQGPRDMIVAGDRGLFVLAIGNALKNAVEASISMPEALPIVVSWGSTDVDYWVSILDHGPGITGPSEAAFGVGRTTKSGHRGFGLAIARQAMITLDGSIELETATAGGARVEIRWFK